MAELGAALTRARELGVEVAVPTGEQRREVLLDGLREVVATLKEARVSSSSIGDAVNELVRLEEEESVVDTELMALRRRLAEMKKLKRNATRAGEAFGIQRDRLALSRWLKNLGKEARACPICEGPLSGGERMDELVASLEEVEEQVKGSESVSGVIDREMFRVEAELSVAVDKLRSVAVRKEEAGTRRTEIEQARFRQSEVDRFLGRVDTMLQVQDALGQEGNVREELEELRRIEAVLRRRISEEGVAARRRRSLEKIAVLAGRLLPSLDTERPDDPIELSITDLTIRVKGKRREDYLWEVGSGANWLSYHVAVSLALQEFFLAEQSNPVPAFLVYDQPSQVYFPRRLAGTRDGSRAEREPVLDDEDAEAVRKVFEVMSGVVERLGGRLQVLVLDHAGQNVWGGVAGIHLVEDWRDGRTLVPKEWLL